MRERIRFRLAVRYAESARALVARGGIYAELFALQAATYAG